MSGDADAFETRLQCADKIEALKKVCNTIHPTDYESGMVDGYNNAIDAILAPEMYRIERKTK